MHANLGEVLWTLALGLALLVSSNLTLESWRDWRASERSHLNGLRRLVSIEAFSNFAVQWGTLLLLTGIAASTLFVPDAAAPLNTRQILIRWAFVVWAAAIVANQVLCLRRRRRMVGYARVSSTA